MDVLLIIKEFSIVRPQPLLQQPFSVYFLYKQFATGRRQCQFFETSKIFYLMRLSISEPVCVRQSNLVLLSPIMSLVTSTLMIETQSIRNERFTADGLVVRAFKLTNFLVYKQVVDHTNDSVCFSIVLFATVNPAE